MNIVVLTNRGSVFGKAILRRLLSDGLKARAAVVVSQPLDYHRRLFRRVRRQVGVRDALFFSLRRLVLPGKYSGASLPGLGPTESEYGGLAREVFPTRGTNSGGTIGILRALRPDILVLGQAGIVGKEIIGIPGIGTLNAHPGVLPYYRGIDSWKWAVYNGEFDRIGCSVHWVDAGVDTGNVIATRGMDIARAGRPHLVDDILYEECVSLLAAVIARITASGRIEGDRQPEGVGRQYYKMSRKQEKTVRKRLDDRCALRSPRR